ncbi:MAG: hypothetical protein ACFWTZ_07040 [Burkholderia sp.]|jgi:nitric oxide dioxygenase
MKTTNAVCAASAPKGWRPYRLINRIPESRAVTSFYFKAADGKPLPAYRAGQYMAVKMPGIDHPLKYIISCSANSVLLRLTVETDELPSVTGVNGFFDRLKIGDTVELSEPMGDFVIDPLESPVVLIAEGLGVSALVAMLSELSTEQPMRSVDTFYSTVNGVFFPLRDDLKAIAKRLPNGSLTVFYTDPLNTETAGVDYTLAGEITIGSIGSACLNPEADYYICGGLKFIEELSKGLARLGTKASRIHMLCIDGDDNS